MDDVYLTVGCAEKVITPDLGAAMAGSFGSRKAAGVRDDIFARAFALGDGPSTLVLVSCDLAVITAEIAAPAKKQVMERHGIPPHQICISATHTHTAPEIRSVNTSHPYDPAYNARLVSLIADVISAALANRFEARMHYGRAEVEGLSFNRLYRLKDGSEIFGRGKLQENAIIGFAGPLDTSLQTLCFRDRGGRVRAIMVNFACHPDTHPDDRGAKQENLISADWPGEMIKSLRAVYGQELHVIFLQGCSGDINHVNYDCAWQKASGEHKTLQLGRGIAGAAMLAAERADPVAADPLRAAMQTLSIPYYTRDKAIMEHLELLRAKAPRSRKDDIFMRRIEEWPYDGLNAEAPIQAMRLGDVGIVGLPAEIFNGIGMEIKHYAPAAKTLVVELANTWATPYVPTTDQAERGGYGALPILSRHLRADAGRRMSECAIALLHDLWN